MSLGMEEEFKPWMAKRKAALMTEIFQGKPGVAEASRAYDMSPVRETIQTTVNRAFA